MVSDSDENAPQQPLPFEREAPNVRSLRFVSMAQEQIAGVKEPVFASMSGRIWLGDRKLKPWGTTLLVFQPILEHEQEAMEAELQQEVTGVLRAQIEMEWGLGLSDDQMEQTEFLAIWKAGSIAKRTERFTTGADERNAEPLLSADILKANRAAKLAGLGTKELRAMVRSARRAATEAIDRQRDQEGGTQ